MSKASQYIILCEDKLHEVFVFKFLRSFGVACRAIRTIPYPDGDGCGEQHVREKYPDEVKAYRDRQTKAQTVLIVVIDADPRRGRIQDSSIGTIANRQKQFKAALESESIIFRSNEECIVHLIPKRHIETWLAFLDNPTDVNEEIDYKTEYGFRKRERKAHPLIVEFAEMFRNHQEPENCIPSLKEAFQELERLRGVL